MKRIVLFAGILLLSGCGSNNGDKDAGPGGSRPQNQSLHAPTCKPIGDTASGQQGTRLTEVFAGLGGAISQPMAMVQAPGDDGRWYVAELYGRVSSFPNRDNVSAAERVTEIDLRQSIYAENEAGLLSLAAGVDASGKNQLFVAYTVENTQGGDPYLLQVARFAVSGGARPPLTAGTVLFSLPQPHNFHIGGNIALSPPGTLWLGTGMGDTSNGPKDRVQDGNQLYGKILRLDVNASTSQQNGTYGIPADNPDPRGVRGRPEVYATGFRHPWRFSFDAQTGGLWVADVGEAAWEEINIVTAGENYGWPVYEGPDCNTQFVGNINGDRCATTKAKAPFFAYSQDTAKKPSGRCVVGGFVYRGKAIPSLVGTYVFGDCLTGSVWGLRTDRPATASEIITLGQSDGGIISFAQDNKGELYLVNRLNKIYRLDPSAAGADSAPQTLVETGCFADPGSMQPVRGVVRYSVRVPLWSDGADKGRFISLPEGATIAVDPNGQLDLPVGTVLIKNFERNGMPIETRLYGRQASGTWSAHTYAWRDGKSSLVPNEGADVTLRDGTTWHYPSRAECAQCHNAVSGQALGWQLGQLNMEVQGSGGKPVNQLTRLANFGFLAAPLPAPPEKLPAFASPSDPSQSQEARARAYLHVNCAVCHAPGGQGLGGLDLRIGTQGPDLGVCNKTPGYGSFGIAGGAILVPGNADASILSHRMRITGRGRMPAVASNVVDKDGTALIDAWIDSLRACP